jgi:hypothetical protein
MKGKEYENLSRLDENMKQSLERKTAKIFV